VVDDTNGSGFSSSWAFYYLYPECGSSAIYLQLILNMIKIFKRINKYIRAGINILVRLILSAVYFILLFPFAIFIKSCTDFLEIKRKSPYWIPHNKIEDVKEFLAQQ